MKIATCAALAVACLFLLAAPVAADSVTGLMLTPNYVLSQPASAWSPGPAYIAAQPYILAILDGVVLPIALTWLGYLAHRFLGVTLNQAALTRVHDAAMSAAGRVLAAGDARVATMSIGIGSPLIAAEVPFVESVAKDAIKQLDMTPERVAALIQGKLGQLQAQAQGGGTVAPAQVAS